MKFSLTNPSLQNELSILTILDPQSLSDPLMGLIRGIFPRAMHVYNAKDALIEHHPANPSVRIALSEADDNFLVVITDNGGGIPEEIIVKIFDPYFSTKKQKNGTGLGLYMSKIIVENHLQGSLSV